MASEIAVGSRFFLGRMVVARPRLFAAVAVAIVAYFVEPLDPEPATRFLIAWNIGTCLYITLILVTIGRATAETIRWRAKSTDEGRFIILFLVSLAALASVGAIFAQLVITKDMKGLEKALHLSLAGLTILSAWVFIHLTFAMHYAHEYFDVTEASGDKKEKLKGGVDFPGTDEPDYWDFLYFAFIIGVAAQTADVAISSKPIRRTSLVHSILAFFFNSAILALTINIAASLI